MSPKSEKPVRPKPLRIFLAEDNPGDVMLIREALREHQIEHELLHVSDGSAAKAYLESLGNLPAEERPDLLLFDLNLPKCDGDQLLALFRADRRFADTPVIIVTSSNAPRDRERAVELGASRYFRKPSDLNEYLQLGVIVRDVIESRGDSQSARAALPCG